jgi:hypothetical protein
MEPPHAPPPSGRTLATALLCVALAACGAREDVERVDRGEARLSLYRIEPVAGSAHAQRVEAWQVAVIEGVDVRRAGLAEHAGGVECDGAAAACDAHARSRAVSRGATVIEGLGRSGIDPTIAPGERREVAIGRGGFESAFGGVLAPGPGEPLRATVSLVARCPVRVDRVSGTVSQPVGGDVVARRRAVPARWLEARAGCVDATAIAFETATRSRLAQASEADAREAAARRAEWDAQQAGRDAARRDEVAARDAFGAALIARAAAAGPGTLPRTDRDAASVEAWVAPRTEAAMGAARIVEIRLESRCAAFGTAQRTSGAVGGMIFELPRTSQHRPCLSWEHVATVVHTNGRTKARGSRDGWPLEPLLPQVARIALDAADGRIRIEPPPDPPPIGPLRTGEDGALTMRPERPGDVAPSRVAARVAALVEHLARWDGDGTQPWEAWLAPPPLVLPD